MTRVFGTAVSLLSVADPDPESMGAKKNIYYHTYENKIQNRVKYAFDPYKIFGVWFLSKMFSVFLPYIF